MRKFAIIMPIFAILSGVAGMLLRTRELATAFDQATGLPLPGVLVSRLLIFLSLGVFFLFLLFGILAGSKRAAPATYPKAFPIRYFFSFAVSALSGIALLVLAVLDFLGRFPDWTQVPLYAWALYVFAAFSAVGIVALSVSGFAGKAGGWSCFFSILPPLFFCFLLLVIYRENGANPVLQDFVWLCLTCAGATLAFYYMAGFLFGRAKTRMTIIINLTTLYLGTVILADLSLWREKAIVALLLLFLGMNTFRLIANLSPKTQEAEKEETA